MSSAAPERIAARAWCRVDLAGGTLDIWPLGLLHEGARTVNLAVDVAVRVELTKRRAGFRLEQAGEVVEAASAQELALRPDSALIGLIMAELDLPPATAVLESDSPRGGGLGASSALAVALIAAGEALCGRRASTAEARAALARDLEARLMGLPTGRQDHYAALLGGALEILHRPGGESVRALEVDLEALAASLVVAYSGQSHFSAATNWQIIRRRLEGELESVEAFSGISEVAARLPEALEGGDLERVGELVGREWSFRRRLAKGVSTAAIERLLRAALDQGAWGGKACGAGGGGCVVVLCPPERRRQVSAALREAGAQVLAARPASGPLSLDSPSF